MYIISKKGRRVISDASAKVLSKIICSSTQIILLNLSRYISLLKNKRFYLLQTYQWIAWLQRMVNWWYTEPEASWHALTYSFHWCFSTFFFVIYIAYCSLLYRLSVGLVGQSLSFLQTIHKEMKGSQVVLKLKHALLAHDSYFTLYYA